jgi:predicted transcriptional regulator
LHQYLNHRKLERQRWQDTVEGLEGIPMSMVIDGDKVHAWLESWGAETELSVPK